MAETAEALVDSLLRRLRDPLGEAHPRSLALDVYSRVQVALNAFRAYVLGRFDLVTTPGKSVYAMDADIYGLHHVSVVDKAGLHIDEIPMWRDLWKLSTTWQVDQGPIRGWAMVGLGLFAIWPTPPTPTTLTLSGPRVTPMLTDDDEPLSFRREDADIALDLANALLLLRWRDLDMVAELASRAGARLSLHEANTKQEEARL